MKNASANDGHANSAPVTERGSVNTARKGLVGALRGNAQFDALCVIARRFMQRQHPFAGYSHAIAAIRQQIAELAASAAPVFITGERGAGKSNLAVQLHLARSGPFGPLAVTPNFSDEDDSVVECLCGGSGASLGKLSNATLVIDNIENLAGGLRPRLFGMLPSYSATAATQQPRDGLMVVVTSRWPLDELGRRGVLPAGWIEAIGARAIGLPPLRRRREDIESLVTCFTGHVLAESPRPVEPRFGAAALKKLRGYGWPGNVRKLRAVVETAVEAVQTETISPFHIVLPDGPHGAGFAQRMSACEKALLVEALVSANYRQTKAAELLGMSYDQFRHYFKKYNLRRHAEL